MIEDTCYLDRISRYRETFGDESILVLFELLSNLVFRGLNQAATWSDSVTSIPSLNFTPVMTFAR